MRVLQTRLNRRTDRSNRMGIRAGTSVWTTKRERPKCAPDGSIVFRQLHVVNSCWCANVETLMVAEDPGLILGQ